MFVDEKTRQVAGIQRCSQWNVRDKAKSWGICRPLFAFYNRGSPKIVSEYFFLPEKSWNLFRLAIWSDVTVVVCMHRWDVRGGGVHAGGRSV